MKKESKSAKIIIDTNIWISFLIGKSLKRLQYYIDSQSVKIIICDEQVKGLLVLKKVENTSMIKFNEFEKLMTQRPKQE